MQYSSFTSSSSINNLRLLSTTQRIRHDRNVRDMNNNWCSNSSSSNSGPTRRGFGLPLSDTMSTTTTNNNPTTKKKNKKKKKNNKNEPNINTNPAPELSLTSQSGPSGFDSRNKVKAAITTSSSNDHEFNLKLQAIKRSAVRKKKLAQTTQYGAIDYDQPPAPPNSNNTDAPKTLGRGSMVKITSSVSFSKIYAFAKVKNVE